MSSGFSTIRLEDFSRGPSCRAAAGGRGISFISTGGSRVTEMGIWLAEISRWLLLIGDGVIRSIRDRAKG